jgi:TolB-like protein
VLSVPAWGQSVFTEDDRERRSLDATVPAQSGRVLVLPFTNLSGNARDDWFGVGIMETVAAALHKVPGVTVVRALGAAEEREKETSTGWMLSGAYQRVGEQIRITARLASGGGDTQIHTAKVDGTVAEFFSLQDQLATELGDQLAAALDDVPEAGVVPSATFAPAGVLALDAVTIDVPTTSVTASDHESSARASNTDVSPPAVLPLLPGDRYRVEPRRVERGPRVDGNLDDEVWLSAVVIDDFVQQEPSEGDPATERTVVRFLYDARALYIGVEAFDSEPDGVIATEMRRDSSQLFSEDNFQIILDTFSDSRSGYMFVTNPLGAKLEQQVAEEGEGGYRGNSSNINLNWDGVWDVAAQRTDQGWVAEIAIPMITMRFPEADHQVWGVNFMRNIRRKNEQVFWAPIPKGYSLTRVSLAGQMTGLGGVERGMDLRITPYVLAGGRQDRAATAGLDDSGFNDIGLDVKYGLSSGLNLDVTVNTDFAQVEVDEQQVNLTRFPLFFPEKRDFFLENAGMFSVKSQGIGRLADLFFTRRVGLANGQAVPIIAGTRLTGKVDRNNIAVMNIQTQRVGSGAGDNFFVARYSRDIFARSKVGGLIVNKESIGDVHYNRTFAIDTSLAPHQFFSVTGFIAKTESPQLENEDLMGHLMLSWLSPAFRVYSEYTDIQDNFNAEVGFVPRIGIRRSKLHGQWNPRPGKWGIRSMDPMWNVEYTTDQNNRLLTRRLHHMMGILFEDGSSFTFIANKHFEQLDVPFDITGDITIPAGAYRFWNPSMRYKSDPSRRLSMGAGYAPQAFFGGTRTDWNVSVNLRASSRVAAQASFRRSDVNLPDGAFIADLSSVTFDLALSPKMTLRSLTQHNSTIGSINTSIRFNWIYSPGSDIYIAYDELRYDDFLAVDPTVRHMGRLPWVQNRQLAIKMTYLLSR